MTKSVILNKLMLIQQEIEQLELIQKEGDSFYFEETTLNGERHTPYSDSSMSYFTLTLDSAQTKLFVDSVLKMKNDEYAKLFREITDIV